MQHIDKSSWTAVHAAHLANRAGFGMPLDTVNAWAKRDPRDLIEELTSYKTAHDAFPPPQFTQREGINRSPYAMLRDLSGGEKLNDDEKRAFRKEQQKQSRQDLVELRAWWLYRMKQNEQALQEKLTLFWHGHFATSVVKVKQPYAMYQQNATLRRHSNGNFEALVNAVSEDPAMLRYLDNVQSKRSSPNENYARELMELFTLGEGHYSEQDIKESARAFTGCSIDRETNNYLFRPFMHDPGQKTFLGQTGNFKGEDIAHIILQQPQAARFICRKLWTFFAYEDPETGLIDHLAETLRSNQYNLQPLLRELFSLEAFYDPDKAIRQQIKSPVQWYIQMLITLQARALPPRLAQGALNVLGQSLFEPPNVKGWDGGATWITAANLFNRYNLAGIMVKGMGGNTRQRMQEDSPMMGAMAPNLVANMNGVLRPVIDLETVLPEAARTSKKSTQQHLFWTLFQSDLRERDRAAFAAFMDQQPPPREWKLHHLAEALHVLMSTPQYQLT